ncbi:MAG: hypothetical protein GPI92_09245 [Microcystis aeruginosa K13-06]|nr:hypothetical protein [Microcystis aeruginosa K13-06]
MAAYLSHRDCQARSHLERLSYFVHNPKIRAETFYAPLIKHFLSVWSGEALELTLDTSMLWVNEGRGQEAGGRRPFL